MTGKSPLSAGETAYAAILRAILNMEIQPGESVSEGSLAEQLGISRTPVREAIKRLEHEGLITVLPRRGSIVATLDPDEIEDGSELRAIIECRCLERGFRFGITDALVERLRQLAAAVERARQQGDLTAYIEADVAFHDGIVALGRSHWSQRIIGTINTQLQRARYWTSDREKVETTLAEHAAIVDAVAAGDQEPAVATLRAHILRLPPRVAAGRLTVDESFWV
ncbi:MAG TPA: GntR family transcriptional regulator [Limnochordia bacterium]|nr:GntR family transcriptional regulator [Limnochordia bacterium]